MFQQLWLLSTAPKGSEHLSRSPDEERQRRQEANSPDPHRCHPMGCDCENDYAGPENGAEDRRDESY